MDEIHSCLWGLPRRENQIAGNPLEPLILTCFRNKIRAKRKNLGIVKIQRIGQSAAKLLKDEKSHEEGSTTKWFSVG